MNLTNLRPKKRHILLVLVIVTLISWDVLTIFPNGLKYKDHGGLHYFPQGIVNPIKMLYYKYLIYDYMTDEDTNICYLLSKEKQEIEDKQFSVSSIKTVDNHRHILIYLTHHGEQGYAHIALIFDEDNRLVKCY